MAVIIDIDHETNDLSQYTSTLGSMSVSAPAALAGTSYGAEIDTTGSVLSYGTKDLAANSTTGVARMRFYVDPNSLTMGNGDGFYFVEMHNGSWLSILSGSFYRFGGEYNFNITAFDDLSTYPQTSFYPLSDAPHYIEILITRAATNVSADGSIELFFDGVSKESVSGIDNYDTFASFRGFHLGAIYGLVGSTSGVFYVDQVIVNDDGGEIGPYVPPSTFQAAWAMGSNVMIGA